jgi:hypothetical protein
MKANELRIGNLFEYHIDDEQGNEWIISEIDPTDLVDMSLYPDDYRPLKLTTELLERLGFTPFREIKQEEYTIKISPNYRLLILGSHKNEPVHLIERKSGGWRFIVTPIAKITYAHQLQNLYFALTGKELMLKPKNP